MTLNASFSHSSNDEVYGVTIMGRDQEGDLKRRYFRTKQHTTHIN